ncbi:MAG: ATP synthase F1 subunit delta [Elusimicrobia bacterium RIFOXYA2_FULL_40_6]|nr:MAG: ATP synthase F1 subunit delta [Elusimicrobia bacterium RIFOXYA2_FULL_40_6]
MKDIFVSKYYARAFYPVLEKKLPNTLDVFDAIVGVLETNPDVNKFLEHPLFSIEEKKQLLFKSFKTRLLPDMEECLTVLIKKGKISLLRDILEELKKLQQGKENVQEISVESSWELSEKEKKDLEAKLKSFTGRKVIVQYDLNEELIGGLVVKIDDQVIDNSLKAKLNGLKELIYVN